MRNGNKAVNADTHTNMTLIFESMTHDFRLDNSISVKKNEAGRYFIKAVFKKTYIKFLLTLYKNTPKRKKSILTFLTIIDLKQR